MKDPTTNRLLDTLSVPDRTQLLAMTDEVLLPIRTSLYQAGIRPKHAYFITDGIASIVMNASGGQIAEVGIIGREGLAGAVHLLGPSAIHTECFMQIAGTARRVLFSDLEVLFRNSVPMRSRVLEFLQMSYINSTQLSACNALHTVDQRLARWLLIVQDRLQRLEFSLTHEFLAEMLVVQRPTLSIAAATLQRNGVIHYRHGRLTILKRENLIETACECYEISRSLLKHLYGSYAGMTLRGQGGNASTADFDAS